MWIAEQLSSFINLGICKEYPTMARSKSTPGTRASRTGADASTSNANQEQGNIVTPASVPGSKSAEARLTDVSSADAKSVAGITPAVQSETKPQNKIVAPSTRRLEVAKSEPRKNVVPINLEDEIRRRAYELYQQRGSSAGHEAEDWLTAESEVLQRYHHRSA
jgi:Protein of unknown function (DUF2934)